MSNTLKLLTIPKNSKNFKNRRKTLHEILAKNRGQNVQKHYLEDSIEKKYLLEGEIFLGFTKYENLLLSYFLGRVDCHEKCLQI